MDCKNALGRALAALTVCLIVGVPIFNWHRTNRAEIAPTLDGFTAHLDERIPAMMNDYSIPGVSIALVRAGEIAWTKGYGYADLDQGRKMTTDTLLMAQSISKSVTAWGVMKLVEEGRIGLDDAVTQHIRSWRFPASRFPEEGVTVRRLLSLSAGMPLGDFAVHYAPGEATPSLQETLSGDQARLVRTPGSTFAYSNTSYALLELLVEAVTGRDFAEYVKEAVLLPLGMNSSSFTWSKEFGARIATGYDLEGSPVPAYVYPYRASGGLYATVGDLARFVSAGMARAKYPAGGAPLKPENVKQLYAPNVKIPGMFGVVSDAYGLGHFLETLPSGHKAVWHGGQGKGWMTHFHSVPETGDGIIILTNSQRSWPFFSAVLSDWARWNGFSSVGMGNVIRAETGLLILIGLLFFVSLWQAWRLGCGVMSGKRRFAPFAPQTRLLRLGQLGFSAAVIWGLIWSARQDYLFLESIFPILSDWLGVSLLGGAAVSLASACLPKTVQRISRSASRFDG